MTRSQLARVACRTQLVERLSVLLLVASALAVLGGAAAGGTIPLKARPAEWMIEVERLIGRSPMSVSVVEGGRLVYAHAGSVSRSPASNEKLLLSMALLDRFGPADRIATTVQGPRPANRSVAGDLWLVGHGDPELNDAALARLARRLRAAGIQAVHGSIVGVTSTFTRERWAPGWRPTALQFIAPPTALTFDANSAAGRFVLNPELRAAAALTLELRKLGVRVSGPARAAAEPATSAGEPVLAAIRSARLLEILRRQNRDSLNLDAEVLTKLLGAAVFGPPGSTAKGARAVQSWAREHGVAAVAHDGSGLSYTNRISTNGITRLLSAKSTALSAAALRSTLPGAGEGTLAGRLVGLRVRAKTGTLLEQISALSGWLWLTSTHRWAEFSLLSRGLPKPQAVILEDRVAAIIAKNA